MIPKVIHYCWFGEKAEPESVKKCIQSWKKYCPEYKIVRWDEKNFDITSSDYCKEAYQREKWAFVSDYARLKIIYDFGGIYLDTDVELISSLNSVLDNKYFLAMEKDDDDLTKTEKIQVATGLGFGAEKNNQVIKALLDVYEGVHFINNGKTDTTPCPVRNTNVMEKMGYIRVDKLQCIAGGTIYPSDYFCPEEYSSKKLNYTENTISIHHFTATWRPSYVKVAVCLINAFKQLIGKIHRK